MDAWMSAGADELAQKKAQFSAKTRRPRSSAG
jgi:hypothetical protein